MTLHIIYMNYLNPSGEGFSIGGIQTYISNLISLAESEGYRVCVYQKADIEFHKCINKTNIYGVKVNNARKLKKALLNRCLGEINFKQDVVIWAAESLACRSKALKEVKTIIIQHGIYWDKCSGNKMTVIEDYFSRIKKFIKAQFTIRQVSISDKLVCVDYNFGNWYRALVSNRQLDMQVIPNFTTIPTIAPIKENMRDVVRIIFARRFFPHRGTRIFAGAIVRILAEYQHVYVTIAGDGPDKQWLHKKLDNYKNIEFINFSSEESLLVHADKHIAVVPTIGSEGTSLSLLEAMASKCAVISTNVGGMTNIVIDEYNGLMINPDEESLYIAIKKLLDNPQLCAEIADKAYETVEKGFSLDKWQNKWKQVLKNSFEDEGGL